MFTIFYVKCLHIYTHVIRVSWETSIALLNWVTLNKYRFATIILLFCIVLYCIVLYCIVLYCIVLSTSSPFRCLQPSKLWHLANILFAFKLCNHADNLCIIICIARTMFLLAILLLSCPFATSMYSTIEPVISSNKILNDTKDTAYWFHLMYYYILPFVISIMEINVTVGGSIHQYTRTGLYAYLITIKYAF